MRSLTLITVITVAATWTPVPSPNAPGSNELLAAAASASSHVWAVGRVVSSTSTFRTLVLRHNGTAWTAVAHPRANGSAMFRAVDAPSNTDAWAAGFQQGGQRTLLQHWDGTAWTTVASPNPNPNGLNELRGLASVQGSLWAVGSYSRPNANYGSVKLIAQRSSSGAWRTFASPAITPEDFLEAVDAAGPTNAWSVGWGSTSPFGGVAVAVTLRWNGSSWVSVPLPQPSQVMLFGVEALAPNNVWAVGHTYPGGPHWIPAIYHWNGSAWSRATIPAFPNGGQLRDIVALSPSNVYAVGLDGEGLNAASLVLHWDGTAWTRETTAGPKLYGAAAVSPSTVWGVGYGYNQNVGANQTATIRTTNG